MIKYFLKVSTFIKYNTFNFLHRGSFALKKEVNFEIGRILTVSHFRIGFLKRVVPTRFLVWLDSIAALTGNWWQLSPSVFVKTEAAGDSGIAESGEFFRCPECKQPLGAPEDHVFTCSCGLRWGKENGIHNFKTALK